MLLSIIKVFAPTIIAFAAGIIITPFLTDYLYKNEMWKKRAGKSDHNGTATPIFDKLHAHKEVGTPRMGGIIIWVSTVITALIFALWAIFFPSELSEKFNFLSRNQTWLPLFTLVVGALVGLMDDYLQISRSKNDLKGGLHFKYRALAVLALGILGGAWFYFKLDVDFIFIPFFGELFIGWLIIPLFVAVMLGLFSSGVVDGLDGLSGGIMASIFTAYACIAFFQNQVDLAALCGAIAGATLAFLWFNIPPARFYMTETGILGLTTSLSVIAFLTQSIVILPIIAFPLMATSLSVIIQVTSKKLRNGKKVFLVAPLHHHFEALGWPAYKVVMRYWIISVVCAIIGMIIAIAGNFILL
ncbi:MAG: phospho-N-acetylmuramoyl-pentapeptide-transferase [Candidatus Pacebacteria bacterium]|nr:phospho-N-acetylmuramoyl-pentapeptide-transferase [Candidatus Paceibacterota bacterium]